MHSGFSQGVLKPAGWFALAYLGYWWALFMDQLAVPLLVTPLAGAPVLSWELNPFRAAIENAALQGSPALATLILALPLLLQASFLLALVVAGDRIHLPLARIALDFTALWILLAASLQTIRLAYAGRVPLVRLFAPLSGQASPSLGSRIIGVGVAVLLLLAAGRICTGRLIAEARSAWLPPRNTWPALLALILPVLVISSLASHFTSAIHFLGPRVLLYLLVPVAACLLLALPGLSWKPSPPPSTGLNLHSALAAVCISAALYGGLQQANDLRRGIRERHLELAAFRHYEIYYDPKAYSLESIRALAGQREQVLATLAARLNFPLDVVHLRVVLYRDLAALRAATGREGSYSVNGTTIRATLGGYIDRLDPAADAAALLDSAWGRPGSPRLGAWVARWLAGEWHGRDVTEMAAQIEREIGHYTLAQLVDRSSDPIVSPLSRSPLCAAWVGAVFDRSGLVAVQKLYAAKESERSLAGLARLLGVEPAELEQNWQQWSAANARRAAEHSAPVTRDPAHQPGDSSFFFRGISFSHEGWRGHGGGYVSPEAAAELRRLKALGANAIAVVPYGFARGANAEAISYTGTDETDEDLTQALRVAHDLGMKVMLKPQLWVSRGRFTGAIRFDDPAARAAWMRSYREFILHYARLADLEHFDLLSIGTELSGLTPNEDDWRRLIAEVRRVYHGPLTYAANWGHEFDSIGFWDALDYIGVNNYYSLAAAPATTTAVTPPPSVENLLPAAERLAVRLEAANRRWHRPILFTEVGYPSVRGGASEPWIEDPGRGISLEEQAAAYEAIFRAFSGRPWFHGMFWWKWPSSGRGGGPHDASYTPLGKPAAEVLRAWFARLADTPKSTAPQVR